MFDEPFRARFAGVARLVTPSLRRAGVTANHVTVAAFVVAVVAAVLIARGHAVIGVAVWLVSRIGDGIDGVLARETGSSSAFGGYLDITLDMAAYVAVVCAFAALHPAFVAGWLAVLAGYVLVITTTLALSDAARGSGRKVSATDRTFQFTAGVTEAGETNVIYALWALFPGHVGWLVWIWAAALLVTTLQRSYLAWRVLARG